eukprot:11167880-Ditylum_brightwellii.AAC.1
MVARSAKEFILVQRGCASNFVCDWVVDGCEIFIINSLDNLLHKSVLNTCAIWNCVAPAGIAIGPGFAGQMYVVVPGILA